MRRPICWQIGEGPNLPRTLTNKRNNQTNNAVEDPDNIKAKKPLTKVYRSSGTMCSTKATTHMKRNPRPNFFAENINICQLGEKVWIRSGGRESNIAQLLFQQFSKSDKSKLHLIAAYISPLLSQQLILPFLCHQLLILLSKLKQPQQN